MASAILFLTVPLTCRAVLNPVRVKGLVRHRSIEYVSQEIRDYLLGHQA